MSEKLPAHLVLQHSIERALDNFKKVGKNNYTAAKIRSRLSTLKELWGLYQEGHIELTKTTSEEARKTMEYFSKNQFDKTEELYHAALDYMMDCLEEFEPAYDLLFYKHISEPYMGGLNSLSIYFAKSFGSFALEALSKQSFITALLVFENELPFQCN
ncbi:hypothetical protein RF55_13290 [Lasius niger]|uniref:Uncharacterized protein n=1 Tax=Lasius niger TaxID=67767 RepID=A0A0J7KAX6_LASNI|nr:hypothetical protein RF55_13290 [Lasius niger]